MNIPQPGISLGGSPAAALDCPIANYYHLGDRQVLVMKRRADAAMALREMDLENAEK